VVIDKSASQMIAGRDKRSEKIRAQLDEKLSKLGSLETRWITSSSQGRANGDGGTTLFADIAGALADIPGQARRHYPHYRRPGP